MATRNETVSRLGVVSFLNARPLIEGLEGQVGVGLHFAVPSALPAMLREGRADAALIPVIDLARSRGAWERVSDACIGGDGETLTVRVLSRVPPERMGVLHADADSHTSIALARLLWRHRYQRVLKFVPLTRADALEDREAVLLIGDKVVTAALGGFDYGIDLGAAWKQWTGLPFVFAVWAAWADRDNSPLARLLVEARNRGVARAPAIAARMGPLLGWPVALAEEYLTRRLIYTLTPAAREGMQRFLELATEEGIIAPHGELV